MDKILPRNEHPIERTIRVVIGIVLLSLVFVGPKTMWGLLGIIPLATGLLGSCPLFSQMSDFTDHEAAQVAPAAAADALFQRETSEPAPTVSRRQLLGG